MKQYYLPDQYVGEAEKNKEDWWKPTMDYWISQAEAQNDKSDVEKNLNYANGIIDRSLFRYILQPLAPGVVSEDLMKKMPGELRDVDLITYVRERYQGEYMNLPYKFFVKTNNPETVMAFNHGLRKQVRKLIESKFVNLMNTNQNVDTNFGEQPDVDIEKFVKEETQKFFDDQAIDGQNKLELINDRTDFDTMRHQAFFYWFSTEQFYDWRYVGDNGKFNKVLISPDEGYPVDNGEQFVEDNDAFLFKRKISWTQFIQRYQNKLTKEELDYVQQMMSITTDEQPALIAPWEVVKDRVLMSYGSDYYYSNYSKTSDYRVTNDAREIYENIIQFIVPRKVKVLKYIDIDGELKEMEVESGYRLDKENGDIELNYEYIDETWTGVRIGNQHIGIYLKPEKDIIQRRGADGKLKLHFGGKKRLMQEININPIPKRLAPYVVMDRIILLHQERAMAKMKDAILTMPKSLIYSKEKEAISQYFMMMADGTLEYDDTLISADEISKAFRIVGHPAADKYLMTLINLRHENRQEALEMANMNSERVGSANPQGGKAITEQNIFRAKIASTLMIHMFHKALERSHTADLDISKLAWITGESGAYFDKKNNKTISVSIDPLDHFLSSYGVFVVDSKSEEEKVAMYKQIAFSAAQNGQFGVAAESLEIDNAAEGRQVIAKLQKATEEFQKELERVKSEGMIQAKQMEEETKQKDRDNQIQLEYIKQQGENYRMMLKLQNDILNSNNSDLYSDADKEAAKKEIEMLKLSLKQQELALDNMNKQEDRTLKREELKTQKQIAKMNKN